MDQFYRDHFTKFLQQNAEENRSTDPKNKSEESEAKTETQSKHQSPKSLEKPSDIAYENEVLKLVVEKSGFKRQKNFKLQDQLFLFKIKQKKTSAKFPRFVDILDFLHAAFLHVLESIKSFFVEGKNSLLLNIYSIF